MKGIIAVNRLGFIGKDNGLPWRCSADLKHFKELTIGCNLLVGYNTKKDLPPLPNRGISTDIRGEFWGGMPIDWCIGGKKTYEKYCHMFTELHISHIADDTIGDTMMPDLSNLNPKCKVFHYFFDVNAPKNVES